MSGSSSPASLTGSWNKAIDKETTTNNRANSRLSVESGLSGPDYRLVSGVENLHLESQNNQEVRNGHLFREPLSPPPVPTTGVQNPMAFGVQDFVILPSENAVNSPPYLHAPHFSWPASTDAHCLRQQIPPASSYITNPKVETSTAGCGEVLLPLLAGQQTQPFSQYEDTTSVEKHHYPRERETWEDRSGLQRTPSGFQFQPQNSGYRPPTYRPSHTSQQFPFPTHPHYGYPAIRHILPEPRFDFISQQNVACKAQFGSQWPVASSASCYSEPDALSFHNHNDLQQNMVPHSLLIHAAYPPNGDHQIKYPIHNQHPMSAVPTMVQPQTRDFQQRLVDNAGNSSESSLVSGQETAPQSKTIQILDVMDQMTSLKCKYYFKNPDNGGGEIQEAKWDNIDYIYYITFSDMKVAKRVTSSLHKIDNQQLKITPASGGIPESVGMRTVEISGGDVEFLEIYKLYFENPQNGGGPINNIWADKETQKIFITFADSSVVGAVCSKKHQVEEHLLEAKPAGIKHPTDLRLDLEQSDEEGTTVEAIVGPQLKDEMFYRQYFEHYGSVEEILLIRNEEKVLVTFASVEVACQVLTCKHQIDEKEFRVNLTKASTFYPDKLLFKNVPESATKELLKNYMENVSGQDIVELLYSDKSGELLVTFERTIDSRKIREKCQSKPLCGVNLQVHRVPVSNCILVENLNPNTSDDDIAHYFESLRADGGAVLKVQPAEDDRIHVFFEDSEVAQRVAMKKHRLGGRQLGVRLHLECLGSSGGIEDPKVFVLPEPLELSMICNTKVSFLQHSTAVLQTLNESLSQAYARAKIVEDLLKVECTLDQSLPKAPFLARAWRSKVKKQLENCFESVSLDRQEVIPAREDGEKMQNGFKDTAKKHILKVSEMVEKYEIDLLNMSSFPSDIANQNGKLRVHIEEQEGRITFLGELLDIREAQIKMFELFRSTPSMTVKNMTESKLSLLTSKNCHDIIRKNLITSGLIATWHCNDEGVVTVYCKRKSDLHQAIEIIQSSFQEEVIPLDDVSFKVVALQNWEKLTEYLIQENNGTLKISTQPNTILITAISKLITPLVKKEIENFVSNNAIYVSLLRFSPSRQRFLALYWEEKLTQVSEMLLQYEVSITLYDKKRTILVKGTNEGIELARKKLAQLEEWITYTEENFTEKKVIDYLENLKSTKELEILAEAHNCVLSWQPEESGIQIMFSNQPLQRRKRAGDQVLLSPVLSNTTGISVDLLVCAIAPEEQTLSGAELDDDLEFDFKVDLQRDSYEIAKANCSVTENIGYKSIIHAAGPLYQGGNKGEEECLRATVLKCLKTASDSGYTSIALPSFSNECSCYPVDEATRVVVEAVRLFIDTTSDSSIRDVKLYDRLQITFDLFQTALDITSYIREPTVTNPVEILRTERSQRHRRRGAIFCEDSGFYESVSNELKLYVFAANKAKRKALLKELYGRAGGDCKNKKTKELANFTTEKRLTWS